MHKLFLILLVLAATSVSRAAEQTLQEISWPKAKAEGQILAGELEKDTTLNAEVLRLENSKAEPLTIKFLKLEKPGIDADIYAITGQVRYEGVQGKAYLEMWSYFPDGAAFFSRTLGESGPTQHLEGASGWRRFELPFNAAGAKTHPSSLEISLIFPGAGKVWLSDLKLVEVLPAASASSVAWWTDAQGGLVGAAIGIMFGLLCGLLGTLAFLGRARNFVIGCLCALTVCGVLLLIAGVVALLTGQPYGVYYPLLLSGVILAAVCGGNIAQARKRYEELELRRMQAMDA
ncbi:MAG TPA: hypothetical protein VEK08_01680 [Planctomycetota bacterium]|nr:hypothetical protein [Planctomycetota bacterium]